MPQQLLAIFTASLYLLHPVTTPRGITSCSILIRLHGNIHEEFVYLQIYSELRKDLKDIQEWIPTYLWFKITNSPTRRLIWEIRLQLVCGFLHRAYLKYLSENAAWEAEIAGYNGT